MKRISIISTALFLVILFFMTLYGERIYEYITPKVKAYTVNSSINANNVIYLQIPKTALTIDSCVYVVSTEQGFSKVLYSVHRKKVNCIETKEIDVPYVDNNYIYVSSGLTRGTKIISEIDGNSILEDGDKVIIE